MSFYTLDDLSSGGPDMKVENRDKPLTQGKMYTNSFRTVNNFTFTLYVFLNRFLFNSVATTWLLPPVASSIITYYYSVLKRIILDIWNIKIKMLKIIFMLTYEPPCIAHFCVCILRKHIYESKDTVAGTQNIIAILAEE